MIEININLVFTIINLIVLYLLMKKFLFGPILNVMEQRKNMIDQQFASAKDTEEQAYELKGKYEDALKSAKDESMRIVNQAKDEAKVQAERIVKDANTQAGAMLDKAKADIRAGKCYEGYGKQSGRDRAGCSLKDHGREKQQSAGFVPL